MRGGGGEGVEGRLQGRGHVAQVALATGDSLVENIELDVGAAGGEGSGT